MPDGQRLTAVAGPSMRTGELHRPIQAATACRGPALRPRLL